MDKSRQAHLVFCAKCGEHTHIVFSDGSKTAELKFIDEVERAISQALLDKKIGNNETDALFVQLSTSKVKSRDFVKGFSVLDEIYTLGVIEKEMEKCIAGKVLN